MAGFGGPPAPNRRNRERVLLTNLVKKLLFPLTVCILFLGCNTVSDVTPTEGGDLDWARAIADGVAADTYGEGLVMFRVEATYLDFSGFLYDGVQHPFWQFNYFQIDPDTWIRVFVHPDGSTTVTDAGSLYEDEIDFIFTSADVRGWLALARYCYRYITGREDDVCYGLSVHCSDYSSYAHIYLYDATFDKLAHVRIDLPDGTISSFELY
jgi:hypothetical protein